MLKPTKQQVLKSVYGYLIVTIAGILNAVSMFCFIDPCNLIAGGVSGLSSGVGYLVCHFIGDVNFAQFDLIKWIVYFALNAPLLILALIFVRGDFTFKTIWATIVCTATGFLFNEFLPKELFQFSASPLISILFGGVLIGFSMYIASEENGSNGGTEVIAKIVAKKKPGTDLSKIILICNLTIMLAGAVIVMILFDDKGFEVVIYSLIYVYLGSSIMGVFKRGFNHPQKFLIVTTKYEEMSALITERFKRGLSYMEVEKTWEGSEDRKVIIVIVQYRQAIHLKQIIKKCDPKAFTIVKDVHDVFSRPLFNRSYKTK